MRRILMLAHRWCGLFTASFLALAGLTGAVIAWDHELDHALNPQLFRAQDPGPALAPLELARQLEAAEPRLQVTFLPLAIAPGAALDVFVTPRIDPRTEAPYELGFSEVMLDPASGRVLGQREWGAPSLAREGILPFLYRLHYSLHLPKAGSVDLGILLMGVIAIAWTLDAFVALIISFPSRKVWKKSFAFRLRHGAPRAIFDLHRSSGVWLWPLLLVFAFTAVVMNLGEQLIEPVVNAVSPLTPDPWDGEPVAPREPAITRERALELAAGWTAQQGIEAPVGSLFYSASHGFYALSLHRPGEEHGAGLGNRSLLFDAQTGALLRDRRPGAGSAGDLFMAAQFPIHSGRIAGLAGRILVSALGLVVAGLSFTGIWLWAKKRVAQARAAARNRAPHARVVDTRA